MLVFKIAWRNIFRHKGKSFVIGIILFLGALLMTVGNGVISGMNVGLERNIVNGFTGDLILMSDKQTQDSVLFGFMGEAVEPIYNYKDIKEVLLEEEYIEKFLPIGKNMAMTLNEEGGEPSYTYIMGVDFDEYTKMFPNNIELIEGDYINTGTKGALVGTGGREDYYDDTGLWIITEKDGLIEKNFTEEAKKSFNNKEEIIYKDNLVFMGFNESNSTSDIRLPVKGVIKYRALNNYWGSFIFTDIESYRNCLGYFSAAEVVELDEEKEQAMTFDEDSLDAMFSDNSIFVDDTGEAINTDELDFTVDASIYEHDIDVESGAYNLVFIKLKKGVNREEAVISLNKKLEERGFGGKTSYDKEFKDGRVVQGARVLTWKQAAGFIGNISTLIKGALFLFVMFVFFVAVIIIVNTLTMAALERTSEIGMMRAIGAKKRFIRQMFFSETALLSFFFGGLGIISGLAIIILLASLNISTENEILQLVYGGDKFTPIILVSDIFLGVVQLLIVTLLAMIYPMKIASNITPLDAISRD